MPDNDNDGVVVIKNHRYPSQFPPGVHWALDEAWAILDALDDGAIPDNIRYYLAGSITGIILKHSSASVKEVGNEKIHILFGGNSHRN